MNLMLLQTHPKTMPEINVSDPQADVIESVSKTLLFMAGVGSGKSHVIGLIAADFIKNNPEWIGFIGANTYRQLTQSTLKRVFDVWKQLFGWVNNRDFVIDRMPPKHFKKYAADMKDYKHTISFKNGAMIYTASLDNYKVIDGTEFGYALLDETKDTKEEAVKEVISARLRQPGLWLDAENILYNKANYQAFIDSNRWQYRRIKGQRVLLDVLTGTKVRSYNPLMIFTSPAKVDWLNTWFGLTDHYEAISKKIFDKNDYFKIEDDDRCVVISSTYHNEDNLPVSFIADKLQQYAANQNLIDMNIYGSPIAKTGGEFIKDFRRLEHVKKVEFRPDLPVHLSLDFNVAPYMTGLCAQYDREELIPGSGIKNGRGKLRIFRNYCLASPRNSTEDICSALSTEFGRQMKGFFYYGDPSGRNRQTVSKEYSDNFAVVEDKLRRWLNNGSDRVLPNHPSVLTSRDFLNGLFRGIYDIDIEIDESCKELIHDLEYAKEDKNGKMMKPTVKDPTTGQTYEKYGHCLDALRYLVVSLFDYIYETLVI
jgi:hypothetical protein